VYFVVFSSYNYSPNGGFPSRQTKQLSKAVEDMPRGALSSYVFRGRIVFGLLTSVDRCSIKSHLNSCPTRCQRHSPGGSIWFLAENYSGILVSHFSF